jgi:hypothetical protein
VVEAKMWRFILFLSLSCFVSLTDQQLHPIRDITRKNSRILYDDCDEVIPFFDYRLELFNFVNNSLDLLLETPDPKDPRPLSSRCYNYLSREYPLREKLRKMKRCEFLSLPKLCPKQKPTQVQLFSQQRKAKESGLHLVILFLLSHQPSAALASVQTLLTDPLYLNGTIRFLFHLDSSSSNEIWKKVTQFVSLYPTNTFLIPRQEAVDVEWGDISTAQAIHLSMRVSRQQWNNELSTFVVLSETSLVVAPLITIYHFFHRYLGLSYPGSKREVVARTDPVWKLCLNDVSIVCDRRVFHIGWRDHPVSNADGYFHGAHLFAFWSASFVSWLLDTEEGDHAYQALIQRLSQTATSDEFFWATLFYNSPFCHTLAPIFDFKAQTGQELSAHVWSQDCDSSDNWGKEACQSMVHQPIGWWSGNSPEWITAGDVCQLVARQPLFVRKVKSDERQLRDMLAALHSAHRQVYDTLTTSQQQRLQITQLLSTSQQRQFSTTHVIPLLATVTSSPSSPPRYFNRYRTITHSQTLLATDPSLTDEVLKEVAEEEKALIIVSPKEPIYYLTAIESKKSRGKKSDRRVCVRITKTDGSLEWVPCSESVSSGRDQSDSDDSTPTGFVLRNCIGNVTVASRRGEEEDKEEESCVNESDSGTCKSSKQHRSSLSASGLVTTLCQLASKVWLRSLHCGPEHESHFQ